jgi:TRAP-type mannitol/chloroaromatic compound transport system substrate-binding protein
VITKADLRDPVVRTGVRRQGSIDFDLAVAVASTSGAAAEERVRWKMQSAWPSNLIHLGTASVRFAKNIERCVGR